jgi:hypothetical protein
VKIQTFLNLSLACLALQTENIIQKIMQLKYEKTKNKVTKICDEPGNGQFYHSRMKLLRIDQLISVFL